MQIRKCGIAALSASIGLLAIGSAMAQREATRPSGQAHAQRGEEKICLSSKVVGMTVQDQDGQKVGEVGDLLIDSNGQVQYLAIDTSQAGHAAARNGQAGRDAAQANRRTDQPGQTKMAEGKLTLVPWDLAKPQEGATAAQSHVKLEIDQKKLSEAPSFTTEQLAEHTGQQRWMAQVDQFFGQARGAARPELNRGAQDRPNIPGRQPQ